MDDQQRTDNTEKDNSLQATVADIAARSQRLVSAFLARQAEQGDSANADPFNIGNAFLEMTNQMMRDPEKMMRAQMTLWQDHLDLWRNATQRMMGEEAEANVQPDRGDRRFKHKDWSDNDIFDYIKQSYLVTARWIQSTVADVEGLDDKTARKVDFYTRQFTDALSPSNFAMTNPEVLRATLESGSQNLLKGLANLLDDLERGKGRLNIKMTDEESFSVGENIAVTPGKVIFRNDLIELIQYTPTTETVGRAPLLIMPPWINKFYILDLRPDNSLVKWAVDQGHTVFVISWVNPDSRLAQKNFEDYMLQGPLAALDAIEKATGEKQVNVVGYCIGGTLLACTLSYMAKKKDDCVLSATFLTTLVDFEEAGELAIFIDEKQLTSLEKKMDERGYLDGHEMATTFNMLRANDLIWSFVINNYLMGKEPFPFDLLYWNADSTRMPATMHSFYLRQMYQENKLAEPGGITLDGVPIDLRQISVPCYIMATREDHIAPWKSTYLATQIYSGKTRFVLAASGHIAGVVNPPAAGKYNYWTNGRKAKSPDAWLSGATEHSGSWWPDWSDWLVRQGDKQQVPARQPGDGKLKPLGNAPGTYVKTKSE